MKLFRNREHAGQVLAASLRQFSNRTDVIVLALPRGGVPIAYEVAAALNAPLDVLTVRKIGAPWNEELAMGAIASGGLVYKDDFLLQQLGVAPDDFQKVVDRERRELERRDRLYRGGRPFPPLSDKCVIIVDDGLATGASMRAAVLAVRQSYPAEVIVAVPVGSRDSVVSLGQVADRVVCPATPEPFYGVGFWYADFAPTSDMEVLKILDRASGQLHATASH